MEAAKGNCIAVWITLWDTEKDRDEFVKAYESVQPNPKRVTHKWGNLGAVFFFDFDDRAASRSKMPSTSRRRT